MSSINSPLKLRDGKLHIFKQPKSKNFFWRTFLNGKYIVRTTQTDNLALAKSIAENAFDRLRSERITPNGQPAHSWEECEQGLLTSLSLDERSRPSRLKTYKTKLVILRQFFGPYPIHAIKAKTIEDYLHWRKTRYKPLRRNFHHVNVSNKTLSADLLVLRQVLKYAKREEWIPGLPDFPKLTVKPRPGGWFTPKEMVRLIPFGKRWINHAATPDEHRTREYAYQYMMFLVFTGIRVDEVLQVRFEDVQIQRAKPPQHPEDCLFVTVKGGKLSYLKSATEMIGLPGAVRAFERLKQLTPNIRPSDLLFPINPRKIIHQLLEDAGILCDERGQQRTAKSFRHTYIMSSLQYGVDVYVLAQNCRTSVKMIQAHYGSYLTSRMKRAELTKMLQPKKSEREEQ